jgi:hypothetical protein
VSRRIGRTIDRMTASRLMKAAARKSAVASV